jgi:hypothetical protein
LMRGNFMRNALPAAIRSSIVLEVDLKCFNVLESISYLLEM